MKAIILKSLIFIFLACSVIFLLFELVIGRIEQNANFKIDKEKKYVVLGHSHPALAINDSLTPSLKNFAQQGEAYVYTLAKFRKIVQQNPSVKDYFIEVTNNNVQAGMDDWTFGNKFLNQELPLFFPFLTYNDKLKIFSNNPFGYINNFSTTFRNNLLYLVGGKINYSEKIGGYEVSFETKVDSILGNYNQYWEFRPSLNVSRVNIQFLKEILNFANRNNILIHFIRSPMHSKSAELVNEKQFLTILKEDFSETEFLDFKDFPLKNSEFRDMDHLNYYGAKKFSLFLNTLLDDSLLFKDDKQKFIDAKMEQVRKTF